MLGLLRKIFGKNKVKAKKIRVKYLVIDTREDGIWVKDQFIPRKNIITIDPQRRVVIYKAEDGTIKEIPYG